MRLRQESRETRLATPVRALDPLLLLWTADYGPCIGPTLSPPTRLPLSVYQKALHSFLYPKHHAFLASQALLQEYAGQKCVWRRLIATVGMLGLRKVKKLDCHPWMVHWLPECMQSSSGQRQEEGNLARGTALHAVSLQPPHPPCHCRVLWTATLWSVTRCPSFPWPLGHSPACGAQRAARKFQVSTAEVGKQISWWKSSVQVLKLNWNYFEEWESQNPRIKGIQEDIRHGKLSVLSKNCLLVNHIMVQRAWQQTPVILFKTALVQYACKWWITWI